MYDVTVANCAFFQYPVCINFVVAEDIVHSRKFLNEQLLQSLQYLFFFRRAQRGIAGESGLVSIKA